MSLLKNRRGEIDLDLPRSGSLDDPQFSVGGLVVRTITSLLGKAIAAPFALPGWVLGGDAEGLAWLEFEPGRSSIPEKGLQKLEVLARALKDKPALKLEIAARLDPLQDPPGLGRLALERLLESAKSKQVLVVGGGAPSADAMVVGPDEYAALLAEVYKTAKFERPRNLIGLLKEQPVAEMERMMLESLRPDGDELLQLARERTNRVRQWLLETGGIESGRLFMVSGLEDAGVQKGEGLGARVDFSLS